MKALNKIYKKFNIKPVVQTQYHISLYIIIPIIFAGMAILSATISLRVIQHNMKYDMAMINIFIFVTIMVGLIAFAIGFLLVYLLLKPTEGFIEKARQFPILSQTGMGVDPKPRVDKLVEYTQLFGQVSSVLSKMDVKQLFPEIIGESLSIRGVLSQVAKVAPTDSTVMILGESGTGKELIATSIHEHSPRKKYPFIKINCAAIPETLLESELFGHEKGAFTGADAVKKGKFELAHQGTLLLDEIGDMPLSTQSKVLRVLQEKEVERLGGANPIQVDVRFITATNQDLKKMVENGQFREDLYYRLNVFSMQIPPLRDRGSDVPLIINHFLNQAPVPAQLCPEAHQALLAYNWPGNIRELKNVIESASVLSEDGVIELHHLPANITDRIKARQAASVFEVKGSGFILDEYIREHEKMIIIEALNKSNGVQARAADLLGINQRSMWHRIRKYNIDVSSFKAKSDSE